MKNKNFYLLILLIIIMALNPVISLNGASNGLLLWFNTIIPTLLPFMIISNLIQHTYGSRIKYPVAYIILVGLLCGYPMGACSAVDMYKQKRISKKEVYLLLAFCNISSPAFVISYISFSCLKQTVFPAEIIILNYFSVLIGLFILLLTKIYSEKIHGISEISFEKPPVINLEAVDFAVTNSINNVLKLGVYIILFSMTAAFISAMPFKNDYIKYILIGSTEITTGINCIAQSTLSYDSKVALILAVNAFGGLSCCIQSSVFFKGTDISIKKYMYGKFVLAALTMITWIIFVHVL